MSTPARPIIHVVWVFAMWSSWGLTGHADDGVLTWEVSHPELREIFGEPFSAEGQQHRARNFIRWPATLHASTRPAVQPTVAVSADGELFAHSYSAKGWDLGTVAHSTDGGKTWQALRHFPCVTEAHPVPACFLPHSSGR